VPETLLHYQVKGFQRVYKPFGRGLEHINLL
jgi:hypothetical protein